MENHFDLIISSGPELLALQHHYTPVSLMCIRSSQFQFCPIFSLYEVCGRPAECCSFSGRLPSGWGARELFSEHKGNLVLMGWLLILKASHGAGNCVVEVIISPQPPGATRVPIILSEAHQWSTEWCFQAIFTYVLVSMSLFLLGRLFFLLRGMSNLYLSRSNSRAVY